MLGLEIKYWLMFWIPESFLATENKSINLGLNELNLVG